MVWGDIYHNGVMHGFQMQDPPELYTELKSILHTIPCATSIKPEKILVVGDKNEEGDFVSLDDYENYSHDSPETFLWQHLESLAKRIIEKTILL